jgi:hypothetical protein
VAALKVAGSLAYPKSGARTILVDFMSREFLSCSEKLLGWQFV